MDIGYVTSVLQTSNAQWCYVRKYVHFLAFISYLTMVNS